MILPCRELYRDYIIVCVHTVVYTFAYLSIPFSLMFVVVGLLETSSKHFSGTMFSFSSQYDNTLSVEVRGGVCIAFKDFNSKIKNISGYMVLYELLFEQAIIS